MSDVTRILSQIESGDPSATEQLLPLVYAELRKLAAAKLAHEKPGQTLQATALVHEAYLRLVGSQESGVRCPESEKWNGRGHFFAAAAEAMRRILVESARRKATLKHGGSLVRAEFDETLTPQAEQPEEVIAVHEALDQLADEDPLAAELVKLHYFAGFSLEAAAELLGMSRATAYRLWTFARACLKASMQDEGATRDSLAK
ncbi:MAG: sigma-70 family RNA polymerase sigma factor [Pirellulaceae bacterium]|nr:sigma-70 family RNA polymerase sigma factor [Pirellulaceae bacterium]